MPTITNRQIPAKIAARENFQGSKMSAQTVTQGFSSIPLGSLSGEHREDFLRTCGAAQRLNNSVYVVWSYSTPIAWFPVGVFPAWINTGWTIPDTRYSKTTSRHQGIVRRSI